MVTVSYSVRNVVAKFDTTYSAVQDRASDEYQPKVVALADGGFAVSYLWSALDEPDGLQSVLVDFYNADGTRRFGDESTSVDTSVFGVNLYDMSATQLTTGALLVTWSDNDDPGIHYATVDPTSGRVLDEDKKLPSTVSQDYYGDVAALPGGRFAVVRQNTSSPTDLDTDLLIYDRDGVLQGGVHALNDNKATDEMDPAVAVLTAGVNKGAIVIAYAAETVDGSASYGMSVEIWNAAGQRVLSPFAFDTSGNRNLEPDVVALQDGGFAVAYLDNEYGVASSMTVAFFDQNGNFRGKVRADQDKALDGDISLTVLENGYVLLTHTDDVVGTSSIRASLFDPAAMTRLVALATIEVQSGIQDESSVTALKNGTFVTAWHDANSDITDGNTDPGDAHVSIQIDKIVRLSIGDNTSDTITGDLLVDEMFGRASGDTLKGMGGNDVLNGEAGNDTLDGGVGADTMDGGLDSDTFIVDNAGDVVIEAANGGIADRVMARVSYALASGVEVELLTTTSSTVTTAIDLTGNALHQDITGNAGRNTLKDGGGAGDTLKGLGGNDTYLVYSAGTTIVEGSAGGADRVLAAVDFSLGAGQYVEALATTKASGTSAIDLTGNVLHQTITGNAGANILSDGGVGKADTMIGLGGNDIYRVYNAGDVIQEMASQGTADRVMAAVDYRLGAGVHVELLTTNGASGKSAIDLAGNEFAQDITGNAGDNRLEGREGNDTLRGLGGKDTFVFNTKLGAANIDTITDFNVADDRFLLSDAIFTKLNAGVLAGGYFRANTTGLAQDSNDHIIYETDTGKLFYDADGLGGTAGIQFAKLAVGLSLTNADFSVA
ncbi:calcium-binding protein [Mesorhizobium sp. ASY16-5R]|uniref:calcium-binding protein n=1 Tax=Mesorhizobium sp. ASY16-5R TaxID=3445772 RepID=UPI003FA13364